MILLLIFAPESPSTRSDLCPRLWPDRASAHHWPFRHPGPSRHPHRASPSMNLTSSASPGLTWWVYRSCEESTASPPLFALHQHPMDGKETRSTVVDAFYLETIVHFYQKWPICRWFRRGSSFWTCLSLLRRVWGTWRALLLLLVPAT